jgi:multidrug efflux pump
MTDDRNAGTGGPPVAKGHGQGEYREFGLTTFALKHRTSILMAIAITAILGVVSYVNVPKEASPEVTIPIISVSVVYPGVAPRDMETLVARPLEEELNAIADIRELTSTSVEGYSNVMAEFDNRMDMESALQKVREKVDLAKAKLPADAEEPVISEFNLSEFPIMQVNVSGPYGLERLKDVADDLAERLEQIPSVLSIDVSGGLEREVRVDVDLLMLKYYGLDFTDVVDAIRNENVTIPGGVVDVGTQEYALRVAGELVAAQPIEDLVVLTRGGRPIYVRDVATVDFAYKERSTYARLDGDPVVTLDVVKRAGENIIETAAEVKAAIAAMEPVFPPGTVVVITGDQSEFIEQMVATLENSIISGLILVLMVLLLFLGVRNAGFVATSIPLSMLLSFIIMGILGISMNMVVLFSLILALGMLVDNAIVVVENIYRYIEEGTDNWTAARLATGEIAMPIIASTLTTIAAFAPLLFWPGIMGEFMGYLPLTLIITLSSSLFVALVMVPVLCALFMKLDGAPSAPLTPAARYTLLGLAALVLLAIAGANPLSAVLLLVAALALVALHRLVLVRLARWFQAEAVPFMLARYERRLRWSLEHRLAIMGGAAMIFLVTVGLFVAFNRGSELFPESIPPSQVMARIDVPSGTRPEVVNRIAERLEAQIQELDGIADAKSVVATVGSSGDAISQLFMGGADASVTIQFVEYKDRRHDVFQTLIEMQRGLGEGIAGADITIAREEMGPPTGPAVNLEIAGDDPDVLKRLADRAKMILQAAPVGRLLEGLDSDMSDGRQELVIDVDRERAGLYGLSTMKIGGTIRSAIQGAEAGKFRQGEDEFDIVVRLAQTYRQELDALQELTILTDAGVQVPLLSVADWYVEEGAGSVRRKDLERVVTVSSDVVAGENSNRVLGQVQQTLAAFERELPPGYTMRYTGEQQEQQEAEEFLGRAFLIALLLIGFILISQFNSVVKPFIILTSVLMSTVGVLLGLLIFRMPFGIIMTGVGIISLAGVVVNNAIVLIDYVDVLRERDGLSRRDALIKGGMTRFRPVILTAVTTVFGLIPLAIGLNFDFLGLFTALNPELYWGGEQAAWWGPMAIAVIAGLTFATVLTLIMVPVLYSLVDDFETFFARHYRTADAPAAEPEPAAAATPVRERETVAARDGLRTAQR